MCVCVYVCMCVCVYVCSYCIVFIAYNQMQCSKSDITKCSGYRGDSGAVSVSARLSTAILAAIIAFHLKVIGSRPRIEISSTPPWIWGLKY